MRVALTAILLIVPATLLHADRAAEVARIHVEAIGGRERIDALAAFRATGQVIAGEKAMRFTLIAARPNRVRIETEQGRRKVVQGTDGERPPWEFETGPRSSGVRLMASGAARTFMADAEFDDPLVAASARGYAIDYAGETKVDGRAFWRFLVTRQNSDSFSVLVDCTTYLLVMKWEERSSAFGRKLRVVTRFDDFRPVAGVLLPHDVTTTVDGRVTQQIRISRIEPNPPLASDTFRPPADVISAVEKH